jgi:hypothetical protein
MSLGPRGLRLLRPSRKREAAEGTQAHRHTHRTHADTRRGERGVQASCRPYHAQLFVVARLTTMTAGRNDGV